MQKFIVLLIFFSCSIDATDTKTVFLSILARNKAHLLPRYLKCIENQEYDKKLITLYINTNNNQDYTEEILRAFAKEHEDQYREIIFERRDLKDLKDTLPHTWNSERLKALALIRNRSLSLAKESQSDFYFVVDCDNFIAPYTLKHLIEKDKPIIAPLIRSIPEPADRDGNFFYKVTPNGFYARHPEYFEIHRGRKVGTFKVPLVHCTYLIKTEYLDQLSYTDETNDYEFIIFSRIARNNNIDQYICNEKEFGMQIHFYDSVTLEEEIERMRNILLLP